MEQSRRLFAGYAAIAVAGCYVHCRSVWRFGEGICRRGHQARGSPHGGPTRRPAPGAGTSEMPAIRILSPAGLPGLPDGAGRRRGRLWRCWRCAAPRRSSCCISRPGRRRPGLPAVWWPAMSCPWPRQPRGPRSGFRAERPARMPPRPGRRHRRHRLPRQRSRAAGPRPRHCRRAGTGSGRPEAARLACGEACRAAGAARLPGAWPELGAREARRDARLRPAARPPASGVVSGDAS